MSDLSVDVADTQEDQLKAFRLRYTVFSIENGDFRYADRVKGIYVDRNDNELSTLLVAKGYGGELAGSLRLTFRKLQPFIKDELYPFSQIAFAVGLDIDKLQESLALIDRGVVDSRYRRAGVFASLERHAALVCSKQDIKYMYSVIRPENAPVSAALAKAGYQLVRTVEEPDGSQWLHLLKSVSISARGS